MTNLNTTRTRPIVQPHHEAPTHPVLGGSITVRLRREETDGQVGVIEQVVPGGFPGPALHVHPDFDEIFYVIEGSLGFRIGDRAYTAGPGTVAFVPRGTSHTVANTDQEPARSLMLVIPGGFERYFEDVIETIIRTNGLPPRSRSGSSESRMAAFRPDTQPASPVALVPSLELARPRLRSR
jgi:mannose-6-phosphate isomerase-like protein (cupin superfamily)